MQLIRYVLWFQGHEMWNDWGDPFRLYPQLPFDILLPSDAKFVGKYWNQFATQKRTCKCIQTSVTCKQYSVKIIKISLIMDFFKWEYNIKLKNWFLWKWVFLYAFSQKLWRSFQMDETLQWSTACCVITAVILHHIYSMVGGCVMIVVLSHHTYVGHCPLWSIFNTHNILEVVHTPIVGWLAIIMLTDFYCVYFPPPEFRGGDQDETQNPLNNKLVCQLLNHLFHGTYHSITHLVIWLCESAAEFWCFQVLAWGSVPSGGVLVVLGRNFQKVLEETIPGSSLPLLC